VRCSAYRSSEPASAFADPTLTTFGTLGREIGAHERDLAAAGAGAGPVFAPAIEIDQRGDLRHASVTA
jgi:hypothetical protein